MLPKTYAITGANAGLGYETAKALAHQKAEVIMLCRSREKGETARQSIIESTQNDKVHLVQVDLSRQADIREAAGEINGKWGKLDVLINNAAIITSRRSLTEDGIEMQFAVNHLGHFLLTHSLLSSLQASEKARIVNIGSGNHIKGKIHFEDLTLSKNYHVLKAYNQTKLANVLFTYEMDRRLHQNGLEQVSVHCVNPGLNATDIGVKATNFLHGLAWRIRRAMGMPASEGAKCQIFVASSPELDGLSGKYWENSKVVPSVEHSYDESVASQLWEKSKALCQIDNYFSF